jgi:hypothetical protein
MMITAPHDPGVYERAEVQRDTAVRGGGGGLHDWSSRQQQTPEIKKILVRLP